MFPALFTAFFLTQVTGFSYDDSLFLLRKLLSSPSFHLSKRELEGVTFDFVRANEGKITEETLLSWVEDDYLEKYVTTWRMDLAQLMALDAGGRPPFAKVPDMSLFNYDTYIYVNLDASGIANEIAKRRDDEAPYIVMRKANEVECPDPKNFQYTFPRVKGRK